MRWPRISRKRWHERPPVRPRIQPSFRHLRPGFILTGLAFLAALQTIFGADTLSLSGAWRFDLDRGDEGVAGRWFERRLAQQIVLPASLPQRGIGDEVSLSTSWTGDIVDRSFFDSPEYARDREPGQIRVPFWLQPEKYYAGVAWYQREVTVPAEWKGRRVVLFLERPHWETRLWLDGKLIGTNNSLSTPHEYDLGLCPPGRHTLSLRVDNRLIVDIGVNSHAISDHTQGNWNGVVGRIELRSSPPVWVDELQVYPNLANKSIRLKGRIDNISGHSGSEKLALVVSQGTRVVAQRSLQIPIVPDSPGAPFETELALGENVETWDEFHPSLYTLKAELEGETLPVKFGMREVSTQGTQFVINGRKTFIRGTLECCIFPKTGHPPTEVEEWRRILRVARAHGLNLLRFHSYCPPEAAFIAGDELGFYFQVETCWANQSASLGEGHPVDEWVYAETDRILKAYGNHPSFLLMPYGNEPGGKQAAAWLAKYVEHYKALDSRRLWTSGSGWPQLSENQFHVTPDPRIQLWGAGLKSRINAKPPETDTDYHDYIARRDVPVISHEIGQWCVYPDFAEMLEYTGYLKPRNFEIFRETLQAHGLGPLAHAFLLASGKLQTLCYKEDIESALRTRGMGGFELLDLHDFPGQGTALVGVLNPFWESKGYVTAKEYSRFCNATVPLARLEKRVFTTNEQFTARIEAAHFGPEPIRRAITAWKFLGAHEEVIARGELPAKDLPIDNGIELGNISVDLRHVVAPAHCRLVLSLAGHENDWDVWVYPEHRKTDAAGEVLVTPQLDEAARARLQAGGKVLLTIPGEQVRNYESNTVKLGFSSIFWNTAWTRRQAPTTLGLLCDPKHPALAEFPTEDHSNWQWWYLVHRAGALRLDLLPGNVDPVVRVIDDWVTARPLALVIEAATGRGKIVVCGFDLTSGAEDPVSLQMRSSLLDYMRSNKFQPRAHISLEQLHSLVVASSPTDEAGGISIKADSEQEGYEARNAIDGNPETIWHTSWEAEAPGFPHELILELKQPRLLAGVTVLPRQDGNQNGWIRAYRIYLSRDGRDWGEPVAQGQFARDARLKTVQFDSPAEARFVKLVAVSGYADGPWASLAEIRLIDAR